MKNSLKLLWIILAIILLSLTILAHSGRTDSRGGHYDTETGLYHYHNGYPEHLHPSGVCPYEEDSINTTSENEEVKKSIEDRLNDLREGGDTPVIANGSKVIQDLIEARNQAQYEKKIYPSISPEQFEKDQESELDKNIGEESSIENAQTIEEKTLDHETKNAESKDDIDSKEKTDRILFSILIVLLIILFVISIK